MKRLLKSSKFWLSVIGSIFGVFTFKLTGSETLSVLIVSSFVGGVVATAFEDYASKIKGIGGELPPDDDEEGGI